MKKIILLFVAGLLTYSVCAQDTISKPKMLLRPFVENGANFIRNDNLKRVYNTQSMYFFGAGLRFGHPDFQNYIPYAQYTYSSFERISPDSLVVENHKLKIQQISVGLDFPVYKFNNLQLRMQVGGDIGMIQESFYTIDDYSVGFHAGIGFDKKLISHSRIYARFSYNYQKTIDTYIHDFDVMKLAIGVVI